MEESKITFVTGNLSFSARLSRHLNCVAFDTFFDVANISALLVFSPLGNDDCKVIHNITNTAESVNAKLLYLHVILILAWFAFLVLDEKDISITYTRRKY